MRTALKVLLWFLGSLVGLVAAIALVGLFLPREHRVSRTLQLSKTSPQKVWVLITDHASDPQWRRDVKATTRLADLNGHAAWKDEFKNGETMSYETLESGHRLVRRIVESGGPFGGTWTYELAIEGSGCCLTITEDGWVSNPLFRTLGTFVIGYESTLEAYLHDVAARFGESAVPKSSRSTRVD